MHLHLQTMCTVAPYSDGTSLHNKCKQVYTSQCMYNDVFEVISYLLLCQKNSSVVKGLNSHRQLNYIQDAVFDYQLFS